MLAVWRKAAQFDPGAASASTWIFTIARNLRIDAFRRERRGGMAETFDISNRVSGGRGAPPDARLATSQIGQRVQTAAGRAFRRAMRVVELSFFEEKAHAEIATISKFRWARSNPGCGCNEPLRSLLGELS